jgi:hypothetical protein
LNDYSDLKIDAFEEDFKLYARTEMRSIEGPDDLLRWWESRAPSPFQQRANFLITTLVFSASVGRFFSMCGEIDDDEWASAFPQPLAKDFHVPNPIFYRRDGQGLAYNTRRLQFMLMFNGDVENRFA